LLEPAAVAPILKKMSLPSPEQYKEALQKAIAYYHRAGITSTHDAALGYSKEGPMTIRAYRDLAVEGRLGLRIYMTIMEPVYRNLIDLGLGGGFGSDYLKLGSVKLFQDGSIQGLTAGLNEPYHCSPDLRGELIMPQEQLDEVVARYHELGFQLAIHANGDRAIESVLTAMENAEAKCPRQGALRHMIIHCQTASVNQIRRMRDLGVVPNYFVNHVYYWGDRHVSIFLGPDRARRIDPLQSTLDLGWKFVLHSDLPVTPVEPLLSMHNAVNRITREGKVLGPEERIAPDEALKAYTINAAYCSFEEDIKGIITSGKLADFAVLSDNPLTVAPEAIKDIQVEATVVGGRKVYGDF